MNVFTFGNRPTHLTYEFLSDRSHRDLVGRFIGDAFDDAAAIDGPYWRHFDDYHVVALYLGEILKMYLSPAGAIDQRQPPGEFLAWQLCEACESIDWHTVAEALLCQHRRWAPADPRSYPYAPEAADRRRDDHAGDDWQE